MRVDYAGVYEQHVDAVYGYLAFRSSSRQVAEDLTQQTFERGLRGWASFDPEVGSARTWLMKIARHVYIDSRRRAPAPEDSGRSPSEEPLQVTSALRSLERREREAIALRFGGDLRSAEIAEVLGVTVSNAQQILARALRRLRTTL